MKSRIIKFASFGLMIFFFLPFFTVSCSRQSIDFTGLELALGKEVMGQNIGGNAILILLLLIPIVLLIVSFLKNSSKLESIIGGVVSIVGVALLIITRVGIIQKAEESFATVDTKIGFYLSMIGYIVIFAIIIYDLFINKNQIATINSIGGAESEEIDGTNAADQFQKIQVMSSKFVDISKENLAKSSLLQIGYLSLGGSILLMLLVQMITKQASKQVVQGLLLIGICGFLYLKMKYHLSDESVFELQKISDHINKFIVSLKIPSKFLNQIDKLVYLFIGILFLDIFNYYGGSELRILLNILAPLSMYGLFIAIVILLTTDKTQQAFHGVAGYLGIVLISFLRSGLFGDYTYISFTLGIKVLIYWTVVWYLLEYVNQITKKIEKTEEVVS